MSSVKQELSSNCLPTTVKKSTNKSTKKPAKPKQLKKAPTEVKVDKPLKLTDNVSESLPVEKELSKLPMPASPASPPKMKKKKKKQDRIFKMYCKKGEFFNVFKKTEPKQKEKVESIVPNPPLSEFTTEKVKEKKVKTTRGRYKGSKLGEAATHAYGSIVKAFNKAGKKLPRKLKFGIVECTKEKPDNKNKLFSYIGSRKKLDKIKLVPISRGKKGGSGKEQKPFITSFSDEKGEKKYLKETTTDDFDIEYEKRKNKVVVETKYFKIVGDETPEEERVTDFIVHLYEHKVERCPGVSIVDYEKEEKNKEKKRLEKKVLAEKKKKILGRKKKVTESQLQQLQLQQLQQLQLQQLQQLQLQPQLVKVSAT